GGIVTRTHRLPIPDPTGGHHNLQTPAGASASTPSMGHQVAMRGLLNGVQAVAGSNPVPPIILRNKPFGEYVEGLFLCEDASYRSTSVFKWHCTMVELTRRSDGTRLFAWRNVVQIPSPVLTVADRSFEAELLRQGYYGCRHRCSEHRDLD